ncbi:hypothetical protein, partial [Frankia gtarii]|uniref:hypothetical protein n=1 Tax=Frankia gtarii TaxID=2950102 RepID=UPI0021BEA582
MASYQRKRRRDTRRPATTEKDLHDLPPGKRAVSSTIFAGQLGFDVEHRRDCTVTLPHNDLELIEKSGISASQMGGQGR